MQLPTGGICPRPSVRSGARWVLLLAMFALAPVLHAQAPLLSTAGAARDTTPAATGLPASYEVVGRSLALADSAADAEQKISRLADLGELSTEVGRARARQAKAREQLADARSEAYLRPDEISGIHDQVLANNERLNASMERISGRLSDLGRLRTEWVGRRRFWLEWRDSLRSDPEFALLQPEIQQAIAGADSVLGQISAAVPRALDLQRGLDRVQQGNLQIVQQTEDIRARWRETLLERDRPVLFAPAFWRALGGSPAEVGHGIRAVPRVPLAFLREHLVLLLVQLALVFALASVFRALRRRAGSDAGWTRLLRRPWPVAIFVALVALRPGYQPSPVLWELGVWSLLALCTALLAPGMFRNPRKRLLAWLLAGFYPLFLLLQAIRFPIPLFRLGLTAAAAAGALVCWRLARRNAGETPEAGGFTWILRAVAGVWGAILVAEVLGWDHLARWIVQSGVASAFAVFVVALLVLLTRGAIGTLVRTEATGRFRFLRRVGYALAERLVWLVQAFLVVGAALYVLDVWQLIPSPLHAWQAVVGAGFTVGGLEITVGRVLLAALVLYVALLISWMLRAFLQGEVFDRWELEAGVGDSILTLLHYSLVVIGILLALGAIGFGLQNLAIILGALGVGIGFGLQNIVNNFVSGLILLFERPVRVGDTVVIGGEWGTIRKIGLRSTTVVTFDQSEMIVPNGDLISEKVVNWTLSNPVTRLVLPVGVAYGTDLPTVFRELNAAAAGCDDVLDVPPPLALFMGFGDSSLNFELRVWVRRVSDRPTVKSILLTEIDGRFRAAGIEIPFPQRDLHLRSVDAEAASVAAQARGANRQRDGRRGALREETGEETGDGNR